MKLKSYILSVQLEQIKRPIEKELKLFEAHFRESMRSNVALLDKIMFYIVKSKGKQIRPIFVFLSAKALGDIKESTYNAASLVELLHTATLVHDDVVDESTKRRGFFSINALWKNKIAVLVGDYLLSKGLLLSIDNNEINLLKVLSVAVRDMSEGELLQIEKARTLDIKEEIYFEIIRQKTASLISAACTAGAISAGATTQQIEAFRSFGEHVGIAFQIKDDLFDFGVKDIGKPLGIDIKEKKMTLPLIYALKKADSSTKRHILYLMKNKSEQNKAVSEIIQFVHQSGGIEYAQNKMNEYCTLAFNTLDLIPQNEAVNSLRLLVTYVTERDR